VLVHYEHPTPARGHLAGHPEPDWVAGHAPMCMSAAAIRSSAMHPAPTGFSPVRSAGPAGGPSSRSFESLPVDQAVDCIVDECFFTVGQVVGDRKSIDVAAVIWWRDHYRAQFLTAMRRFGNRWMLDESHVKGVGRMLAERAVEYAGDNPAIDQRAAMKAAADAAHYCTLHWRRAARQARRQAGDEATWMAGYYCGEGIAIEV